MEFGVWCRDRCLGVGWRSALGMGWRSALGVVIGVGCRDQRWAWDVEIAVRHGFPAFGSDLDGVGGGSSNLKTRLVAV